MCNPYTAGQSGVNRHARLPPAGAGRTGLPASELTRHLFFHGDALPALWIAVLINSISFAD